DKANMELEAYDEGVLAEVRVKEGESAPVGAVIAVLAEPGEAKAAGKQPPAPAKPAAKAAEKSPARETRETPPREAKPAEAPAKPAPAAPPDARPPSGGRVELSRIRRTTAKRMGEAKREIPHFYASAEIRMDEAVHLKEALAGLGAEYEELTYTHILLKAVGLALRRVPELNGSYDGDAMALH